jgi:hypothetical protein
MAAYLAAAGFNVELITEREPDEFEYQTRRLDAFGRRPSVADKPLRERK